MLRHLRTRGALPVPVVRELAAAHGVKAAALAPHVTAAGGRLTLRLEAELEAGQLVAELPFATRVLLREQGGRLPLKVIDGRLCDPGALRATDKASLLKAIALRPDGVAVVDAVADYPNAHADVLELRRDGDVHAEAGRLWSHPGMRKVEGAAATWLAHG